MIEEVVKENISEQYSKITGWKTGKHYDKQGREQFLGQNSISLMLLITIINKRN